MQIVRIFISSPGDVAQERQRAREVIESLRRRYSRHFILKPIFWEDLPLQPDMSFQGGIDAVLSGEGPDIAVFILWSRLGSPVGAAIPKSDGSEYRSGTEREYDLMMSARKASLAAEGKARPAMLIYTRRDDASFEEALRGTTTGEKKQLIRQKEMVEAFLSETFRDQQTGVNVGAYFPFDRPVTFSQRLRVHLQDLLDQRAGEFDQVIWDIDKQGPPFLGLEAFQTEHAAVFFGREAEILEARHALREQARNGCAFLLLSGPSGSGKSSLARAGVLPAIVENEVDDQIAGWKTLVITPSDVAPSMVAGLVTKLAESALPTLIDARAGLDELVAGLKKDPELTFSLRFRQAIAAASPAGGGQMRVLLVIDQLEECFTLPTIDAQEREAFFAVLETFARSGSIWITATVRGDFYHHLQAEPALMRMKAGTGQLDILPPGPDALARLIEEPARLAGLAFEKRGDQSLSHVIFKDAVSHPELLPLVEFMLRELFERRTEHRLLTFQAYEELGGVEGALAKRAEETFNALSEPARNALPTVLQALVTVGVDSKSSANDDETIVRQRAATKQFATAEQRAFIDAFVAARLFTTEQSEGEPTVTVSHESLLRVWPRAVAWKDANLDFLRVRARVATRMNEGSPLLAGDPLLEAAKSAMAARPDGFSDEQRNWITSAVAAAEAKARHAARLRRLAFAALVLLTVAAIVAAVYAARQSAIAKQQANEAIAQRERAKESRRQAEKILNYMLYDLRNRLSSAGRYDIIGDIQQQVDQYYEKFGVEEGNLTQLRDRGTAANTRGDLYMTDRNYEKARESYGEALELSRKVAAADSQNLVWQRDLTLALNKMATVQAALGKLDRAEELLNEGIAGCKRQMEKKPDSMELRLDLQEALVKLADTFFYEKKMPEAVATLNEALELMRKPTGVKSSDDYARDLQASMLEKLADYWSYQHDDPKAMEALEESLKIRTASLQSQPDGSRFIRDQVLLLERIGQQHGDNYRWDKAAVVHLEAVRLERNLVANNTGNSTWRADFCISLNKLGFVYQMQQSYREAEKCYAEAVENGRKVVRDQSQSRQLWSEFEESLRNLGDALFAQDKFAEAEKAFSEALENARAISKSQPDNIGWQFDLVDSLDRMASCQLLTKRVGEGRKLLVEAIDILHKIDAKEKLNDEDAKWLQTLEGKLKDSAE